MSHSGMRLCFWVMCLLHVCLVWGLWIVCVEPGVDWGVLRSEHAAAWVQAVGSILAILVAVAVPAVQHHLEATATRQRERQRDVQELERIRVLAEEMRLFCQATMNDFINPDWIEQMANLEDRYERFGYWAQAVEALPLASLPVPGAMVQLVRLRGRAKDVLQTLRSYRQSGGVRGNPHHGLRWATCIVEIELIEQAMQKYINETGA